MPSPWRPTIWRGRSDFTPCSVLNSLYGGETAAFTSFRAGSGYLNLTVQPTERVWAWWGRVIFHVADVDALHATAVASGIQPDTVPRDAAWGERFFHVTDPDGHALSFARPLR